MAGDVHDRLDALSSVRLATAVERGIGYVADHRDANGLWRDFETFAGCAVDWVSGFIVTSLGGVPEAREMCERAAQALLPRQRRSGGWGYHEGIPEDADSTAWVLRALAHAPFKPPHAVQSARSFLAGHQLPRGAFTTFMALDAIGAVIGERDRAALVGWNAPHSCVTANVVLALLESGSRRSAARIGAALDYLIGEHDGTALWSSYWWNGPAYATYHVGLALAIAGRLGNGRARTMGEGLRAARNADDGWGDGPAGPVVASHAFATAHGLLATMLVPPGSDLDGTVAAASAWLLHCQNADGSWPSVPILRIPDAHVTSPRDATSRAPRPGTGLVVADQHRLFTTAAAVHALHAYRTTLGMSSENDR